MTLLETMKKAGYVEFSCCEHGYLCYNLFSKEPVPNNFLLSFRIPFADTAGGTFYHHDDNPMYFQRWIRKELELKKEEVEMIAKAKEEWTE